jgi:tRNA threonylcarbamoyladenosine biosynthesis protein TsaB
MLILAIETSGFGGGVALLDDETPIGEQRLPADRRSAQTLLPAIQEMLAGAGRGVGEVGLIGVVIGPGSFTGLRVGVTAAKTLAYALGAKTVGVDALDVIAAAAPASSGRLHLLMDAQRQELFAARFAWDGSAWQRETATEIVPIGTWLGGLQAGDVVSGPAIGRVASQVPPGVTLAGEEAREPRAEVVGRLAFAAYRAGRVDDFWKLTPAYYRPSAAEEKVVDKAGEKRDGKKD